MIYRLINRCITYIFFVYCPIVYSIQIDSLFVIADDQDKAKFTVTNTESERQFIQVGISEVTLGHEEEMKEVPYTRDNFLDWKVKVRPMKAIVDPKFEKDFSVIFDCKQCSPNEKKYDRIFKIAYVPLPYFSGEVRPDNLMQVSIGFASIVLFPGEAKPLSVIARYSKSGVVIENRGDSFITAVVDTCDYRENKDDCKSMQYIIASREVNFAIKDVETTDDVTVKIFTAEGKYSDSFKLKLGAQVEI
ncbi:hypothetical protein [Vibrio cionasavignyae]|uniref:hypothetical protein n=1 Tax=Vibrio cionasavignyae TaxID=2910252 RepID=UPI003D0C214B